MADEKRKKKRGPGFILGTLIGAIAGAAAAILLAPPSEEENEAPVTSRTPETAPAEPERPPAYMTVAEDESLARVRAMLERVRARMREAGEAGQEAAKEQERSMSARYSDLTRTELPRSGDDTA
jgi:gas vesicle protein